MSLLILCVDSFPILSALSARFFEQHNSPVTFDFSGEPHLFMVVNLIPIWSRELYLHLHGSAHKGRYSRLPCNPCFLECPELVRRDFMSITYTPYPYLFQRGG